MSSESGSKRRRLPTRPSASNLSVVTRLALVALVVTLISLAITAAVGLRRGTDLADQGVDDRLVAVSTSRASEVEAYFRSVRGQVGAIAISPGTTSIIEELAVSVDELDPVDDEQLRELTEYYLTDVVDSLADTRGDSARAEVGISVPSDEATAYLQATYSVPDRVGEDEDGEAQTIDSVYVIDPGDGTAYSDIHAGIHPAYAELVVRSGFDDFFLISADGDRIVYSVRKRIDFGARLDAGALSGSALASAVDASADASSADAPIMTDFIPWAPAADEPTAFVVSPVRDGDRLIGHVAVSVRSSALDALLTGPERWSSVGDTGEVFIAGSDSIMRTVSRAFLDDRVQYFADVDAASGELSTSARRTMAATGTTALVIEVDRDAVASALDGPAIVEGIDPTGQNVRAAVRQLDIEGVEWVLFAEVSTAELDRPLVEYAQVMLVTVAIFVIVVTFFAVAWASRLLSPIRAISDRLRKERASGGSTAGLEGVVGDNSPVEFVDLAENIDVMLRQLAQRRDSLAARHAERIELMREFLPAAVASRVEQGGGDVIDHADRAAVVVVVLDGLGEMLARHGEDAVRRFVATMVDEADALAADLGLDRTKLTGEEYVAVCGATRPFLDLARRAVEFAVSMRELGSSLAEEHHADVELHCGVDIGAVSLGLTGRAGLVYDSWGSAVSGAGDLARTAPGNAVAVSAAVAHELPDEFEAEPDGEMVDGPLLVRRVAIASEGAS